MLDQKNLEILSTLKERLVQTAAPALVQIQLSPPSVEPPTTLPRAAFVTSEDVYERMWQLLDKQDEALLANNPALFKEVHDQFSEVKLAIRKNVCGHYHYPPLNPKDPQRWDLYCDSGWNAKFRRGKKRCLDCRFFNVSNHPNFRDRSPKDMAHSEVMSVLAAEEISHTILPVQSTPPLPEPYY